MPKLSHTCPTCGFSGLDAKPFERLPEPPWQHEFGSPPYGVRFGRPSYEVCSCCGFEFGNDDEQGTGAPISFEDYREEWIADGCQWFDESARPDGWSVDAELAGAGLNLGTKTANKSQNHNRLTRSESNFHRD